MKQIDLIEGNLAINRAVWKN